MQTKKIVKGLIFTFVSIVAFFGILQRTSTIVEAYGDSDVINDPPVKGLSLSKYFSSGTFTGNKAKVVSNDKTDYVELTNNANSGSAQTSAVWSNNDKNYLNIQKKQTLSMWMYFGSETGRYGVPDGMAFVLQNGGTDAISNIKGTPNSGETLGVWGSDSNKLAATVKPEIGGVPTLAEQAIQNSFAIEFDTYTNHFNGTTPVKYSDWISNNNAPQYLPDPTNAFDYLAYNYQTSNNNFLYQGDDFQRSHIAWNYPARDKTYVQLSPNPPASLGFLNTGKSIAGMIHNLGTDNLDENGANVYLQKELSNSTNPKDSWRHITIQYTPADEGSNNATLTYKVGDKDPVTGKGAKPITDVTLTLDMSAFGTMSSKKLRYGFTAATGKGASTNSAVIFETMPSLVNAEVNAYTVDKTTKSRIKPTNTGTYDPKQSNQNDNLLDDESLGLSLASTVHPKDELGLNYMFHYQDGEEPATGLKETINVPDNVTVKTDGSGNIGKIYYTSKAAADGSTKTSEIDIPSSDLDNGVLTCNMDNGIGDPSGSNWEYARVELNATANDLADTSSSTKLTVPSTTTSFESDNYKANADSTAFDIVNPADTLIITATSPLSSELKLGESTNITGDISLKSKDPIVKSNMYISTTIDNGDAKLSQDTSTGNGFSIPIMAGTDATKGELSEGDHTIRIHVINENFKNPDGSYDTLISNELVYNVKVTNKTVVITPDNSNITVNDNEPQIISGTYLHSDNTTTADEGGDSTISYTITTADGNKQDPVTYKQANDGKYAFNLKPYAYDKDPTISLDKYTGTTGLKVGKNTVTINITDSGGHKSTSKDVIVNVPDITPTLTTDQSEFSIIQDDPIDMTAKVGYPGSYLVTPSKLTWNINANDNQYVKSYSGNDPVATPITQAFTADSTANGITEQKHGSYNISTYFTDPYGRKSNTLNYSVNVTDKTATIENSDYMFQPVHASNNPRRVKRDGSWNLKVDSVMTPWTLTAKAGKMIKDSGTANATTLDGNIVFVSKDGVTHDLSTPTDIQSDPVVDEHGHDITDVAGNWTPDQGVLLDLNSRSVSGTYTGTVEWGLTDSV
ncbi:hypothetical protein [Companilactobacillus keshanensis]|uniref:Cell surface protein n=1 Tax=Companilactobacillus keshanensis TaxID=2486003 RepID=A0ABW4BVI5_9LACO|nr:hypothetical protein [Companilactobacillus keshanensis]